MEDRMEIKTAGRAEEQLKEKLTVSALAEALGAEWLVEGEKERIIQAGYVCDLLSWAMARLPEGAGNGEFECSSCLFPEGWRLYCIDR